MMSKDILMIIFMILEFIFIFGMVIMACKYDEKENENDRLEEKTDE